MHMLAEVFTRFLVKRQKRKLRRYRSFHQARPRRNESNPSPLLSPNPDSYGVQRSSQMRKRLGLSFRPGNRADFPSGNCLSPHQRPDIVIYLKSKKIVVLIELTCPLEDRISTAHELKKDRYLELLLNCLCNGWTAFHFSVEVGSRGFVAYSLTSCLQKLGFSSYLAKKARNECSKIALRASYSIYLQRNIREWSGR